MKKKLRDFFKTIYTKKKGQIIVFVLLLLITIVAFYFSKNSIPQVFSLFLPWGSYIFLYLTFLMGLTIILGNQNLFVNIVELPISASKIILPEIMAIISIITFFNFYILILLLIMSLYASEVNIYIIIFAAFLGIKLFGGFCVKKININFFGMQENTTVPVRDFSDMTNAAFYLLCIVTILYYDINLLSTSSEEYNLHSIFLIVILTYLTFDSALPVFKKGLQSIFNMKKMKRRYLRFICELIHINKKIKDIVIVS